MVREIRKIPTGIHAESGMQCLEETCAGRDFSAIISRCPEPIFSQPLSYSSFLIPTIIINLAGAKFAEYDTG